MCTYVIAPFIKADMIAIPKPLPETIKISTSSLFLLKYWATISVLQSRVIPTPIPMRENILMVQIVTTLSLLVGSDNNIVLFANYPALSKLMLVVAFAKFRVRGKVRVEMDGTNTNISNEYRRR